MTFFTRSLALSLPAAMIGASLFAGPVLAQNSPPKPMVAKPPAVAAATSSKQETVEQRITQLHKQLQITPTEEPKWQAVAQAMRDNAVAMDKLAASKQAMVGKMTAVDDLKVYQEFAQANVDGLKNVTSAFSDLYDSMPDAQKRVADTAFQKYGAK